MVLRHWQSKVLVNCKNLSRSGVLRTETVAAADNQRGIFLAIEAVNNIEEQRFAVCARFFCSVENGNALCSGRNCCQEVLCREWTIQVNCNETNFLAFLGEVVDNFTDGFGN